MDALYRGDWAFTETVTPTIQRQASGLTAAHLQWHLERQLRTLPLIERAVVQDGHRAETNRVQAERSPA